MATLSSSSFDIGRMNVRSINNQSWNKMSTTWATLNLMMSLFALGFVSVDKSRNLL
jgi:hypothetical protein